MNNKMNTGRPVMVKGVRKKGNHKTALKKTDYDAGSQRK